MRHIVPIEKRKGAWRCVNTAKIFVKLRLFVFILLRCQITNNNSFDRRFLRQKNTGLLYIFLEYFVIIIITFN